MLLYGNDRTNGRVLITAVEGSGDNLNAEDVANGFMDYLMTSIYKQDGEELVLVDAGQMMTKNYVKDMRQSDIIAELADYWDLDDESIVRVIEKGV